MGNDEIGVPSDSRPIGEGLHLKDYFRVISTRRWVLVTCFVLIVGAATTRVLTQTPIFRAKALILIQPGKLDVTEFRGMYDPAMSQFGGSLSQQSYYGTQYKLIVSRPALDKAFRQFGFAETPEFHKAKDPLEGFTKLFAVSPVRRSRLTWVTFEWRAPELAARVLEFVVQEYISAYRQRAVGVTHTGLGALRKKAEEVKPKLAAKAAQLQKFMATHNMVSLEERQNIIVARLMHINKLLAEAEGEVIKQESIYTSIKGSLEKSTSLDDIPEVVASQAIRELKLEYIRAKQQMSDLSERFGPNHPQVRAAKARADTVTTKIRQEALSALAVAEREKERAAQQSDELRRQLKEQEKRVLAFNEVASEFRPLKDSHETLRRTYNAIMKRIEEIDIALTAGSQDDAIFVIEAPTVPAVPARPRKKLVVAVAAALGLLLGIGLCFFVDYLDTTVKSKDDVESLLARPVVGYVPPLLGERALKGGKGAEEPIELFSASHPRSSVSEAFRSIRTALSFAGTNGNLRRFLVTSSSPREGKTLVSANISIALARAGRKVLLIDADMRKPRVHKLFGAPSMPGLSNMLVGEGDAEGAIREAPGIENLSYMPCGPIPPNPAELLGGSSLEGILDTLGQQFDTIVFDTPPLINVTDAAVLVSRLDGALLVVRCFSTDRELLRRSHDLISRANGRTLGVVLNNVDVPRVGYYSYYYDKAYYYQYSTYYYGSEETEAEGGRRKRRRRKSKSS